MKIVSWNINGLRASLRSSGLTLKEFLDNLDADIICLQETKAKRDQLDPSTYSAEGYNGYFSFCKTKSGYSGVVTFCRADATPQTAEEGLTGILSVSRKDSVGCYGDMSNYIEEELKSLDAEGRCVVTEHPCPVGGALVVINVYCPMVESDSDKMERMEYKIRFYNILKARCAALEKCGRTVIVLGDLNMTREVQDSAYLQEDPSLYKEPHPARECLSGFISSLPTQQSADCVLLDTFRFLHPDDKSSFTCWNTLLDCRKTNFGTRIDYILCSLSLTDCLVKAEVWSHVFGSDHCPVFAEFDFSLMPSQTQPSLSSTHFSFGKQTKMSDFFSSKSTRDDSSPPPAKKQKLSGKSVSQATLPFTKLKSKDNSNTDILVQSRDEAKASSSTGLSGAWQSVLKGPPKAPLCDGHKEPCVLRTVKKAGPNLHRQFWVCARPHGSKTDKASRCDFFKWAKKIASKS